MTGFLVVIWGSYVTAEATLVSCTFWRKVLDCLAAYLQYFKILYCVEGKIEINLKDGVWQINKVWQWARKFMLNRFSRVLYVYWFQLEKAGIYSLDNNHGSRVNVVDKVEWTDRRWIEGAQTFVITDNEEWIYTTNKMDQFQDLLIGIVETEWTSTKKYNSYIQLRLVSNLI